MSRDKPWPWPADTQLERVKRLTRAYRDALAEVDPSTALQLDAWAADRGEGWIAADPTTYDDDDLLTLDEVARWAGVRVGTVYQWHWRGLPYVSTPDGERVRMGELKRWERDRRQARLRRRSRSRTGDHPPGG
jgi:hypothetical protein